LNYLAHLYLSGNNTNLLIGNFIADHLKGTSVATYPESVQEGIRLHRQIDAFTDRHPVVMESKIRLRPYFRKYATVIVDIFYDHFLARDWHIYHPQELEVYSSETYQLLRQNQHLLPARAIHMLKYMQEQNWLLGYSKMEGMEKAFKGISRRATFESKMEEAPKYLLEYYDDFENEFRLFFEELKQFVDIEIANLK
jgi:acyl carrier protein phosphodiesterase